VVSFVENFVPKRVKLINVVVVLEGEVVTTPVSFREFTVETVLAVEWLSQVAHVVDEQAEGVGLGDILVVVELIHNVSVHAARLVAVTLFARKPGSDAVKSIGQVSRVVVNVVVAFLALVNIRVVNKVVVSLPALAMILKVIRKSGTLDERVLVLVRRHVRVGLLQIREHLIGSSKRIGCIVLKQVLRNVCDEKMAIYGPCAGIEAGDEQAKCCGDI